MGFTLIQCLRNLATPFGSTKSRLSSTKERPNRSSEVGKEDRQFMTNANVTGRVPANSLIQKWVNDMAAMCQPDNVYWCDGSEDEKERLTQNAVQTGDLLQLNQEKLPGCYLHRSAPNDVARTEHLTFICSRPTRTTRAPPTTGWPRPRATTGWGRSSTAPWAGRTMYVIPFLMGPPGSPSAGSASR